MNKYILELAKSEECFYLYDENVIKGQIGKLKASFPNVEFLYSIKCNHNRNILKTVFNSNIGADCASLNEVFFAKENGLSRDQIYYSAPGKTDSDLKEALPISTIIADSFNEIERISNISKVESVEIGVRINPNFSFDDNIQMISKFGIDEDSLISYLSSSVPNNLKITGIHVHLKSQELDMSKLLAYYSNILSLAVRIEKALGYALDYINMGSGIGIAYSIDDKEIDIVKLGEKTTSLITSFKQSHPNTRIFIETGRYLVCQSGTYVTHVLDKKISKDKTILILKNTLNGFIRPSLSNLINSPLPKEPLYTKKDAFKIEAPYEDRSLETYTLMGNLCTGADLVAEDIVLPDLNIGDIIAINNAGAYAYVLSPLQFSSQEPPKEYMLLTDGNITK